MKMCQTNCSFNLYFKELTAQRKNNSVWMRIYFCTKKIVPIHIDSGIETYCNYMQRSGVAEKYFWQIDMPSNIVSI